MSDKISQLIKQLSGDALQYKKSICKVVKVDGNVLTLEPLNGSSVFEARIKVDDKAKQGINIVPAENSIVIIDVCNEGKIAYLELLSEIKEIDIYVKEKIMIANAQNNLGKILEDLISAIESLTVTTSMGPSGVPINVAQFSQIKTRIKNLLKTN